MEVPPARPLVLLIDDEPEERDGLRGLLEDAGYDVVEASSGRKALNYLTSDAQPPALIVTDLAMPDMSGWELINILQAYVRLSVIPVVVVSGVEPQRHRLKGAAVADVLRKPIDPPAFIQLVQRVARA